MEKIDAWWFAASDVLPHGDGRKVIIGKKHSVRGEIVLCSHALHASRQPFDALQYAPGPNLYRVRCWGDVQEEDDKLGARNREYVAMIDATDLLRAFARSRASLVLHLWDAPQVVRDYLATGDETLRPAAEAAAAAAEVVGGVAKSAAEAAWLGARLAAGSAAGSAAEVAARSTVNLAARSAAEAAEAAEVAARLAARLAVRSAASLATEVVVRSAPSLAARSAARLAAEEAEAARSAAEAATELAARLAAKPAARREFNALVKQAFGLKRPRKTTNTSSAAPTE